MSAILPSPTRVAAGPPPRRRAALSPWWLSAPLALAVATRGDTRDTATYVDIFQATKALPTQPLDYYVDQGVEWGYGLAAWALSSVGLGPRALFLLISALTFFFLHRASRRLGLTFWAVAPYYLGTFFISQQLMQVRQGLGVALAFSALLMLMATRGALWRHAACAGVAASVHVVSALPLIGAWVLDRFLPGARWWRLALWTLAVAGAVYAAARLATHLDVFTLFERLTTYAEDDEYSSARELLDPANVRAALVLMLLLAAGATATLTRSRAYTVLLGLYAAHLGLRLGFLDFQILSGRLSTALGFAEVFLLPLAIRHAVALPALRWAIGGVYLAVHASAMLLVQTPFMIDDYFTPLHIDRAAR